MLRVVVVRSSGGAKDYYRAGDYYADGQEPAGEWGGAAAAALGLAGPVGPKAFDRLCDNLHPATGCRLTARTNAERRVGFDLNWHVPKSLSVLYGLAPSAELLAAFRGAVGETMRDLEAEAQTRVRVGGADALRTTANMVWASHVHTTARPVGGVPDPHLHCHCVAFNATFDPVEGRWKAVDLGRVKRAAPYFEAAFHARLALRLRALGYDVARTAGGWELAGVPARVCEEFSGRTRLIERVAAERGVTDLRAKDRLGARTREAKRRSLAPGDLRAAWAGRLTAAERRALALVRAKGLTLPARDPGATAGALAYAAGHCFERASVVAVERLLAVALRWGVGEVSVEGLRAALPGLGLLSRERDGTTYVTTRAVLAEEARVLAFARGGRGTCPPLGEAGRPVSRAWLSAEQAAAVAHVLGSPDRVILLRGAAGVGKTALMAEAVEGVGAAGRRVVALAPSAAASRGVLRDEGFAGADTVARFLRDGRFQAAARGQVLWVDEAGLLGTRTLGELFAAADRLDTRVVLVGDTKQHAGVERGAALSLLEREAGLPSPAVTGIRRQAGRYRDAVQLLSDGRALAALDLLDRMGWVREAAGGACEELLAAEYVRGIRAGKSVLVVSPTHAEGERVTAAVRAALGACGVLRGEARPFARLVAVGLTAAERGDPLRYEPGFVLQFHQHAPGFPSGSRWVVTAAAGGARLAVRDERGQDAALCLRHANRFQVFRSAELLLRAGDRIRITRNGRSKDGGRKLDNGTLAVVRGFTPAGDIRLASGAVVAADAGHLTHGYCVTSHAAQGKTVDRVLVAQGAESFAASSREQLYVSVSRGREGVLLVTDDKAGLRLAVARSDPRPSATEVFGVPPGWHWRRTSERVRRTLGMGSAERGGALVERGMAR